MFSMKAIHDFLCKRIKLYDKWDRHPISQVTHWTVFIAVSLALTANLLYMIHPVQADTGLQYTFNKYGLQTLTYNGQSYLTSPVNGGYIAGAVFQTPGGTQNGYGIDHAGGWNNGVGSSVMSTTSDSLQQVYNSGKQDSYTVKMQYGAPDSQTLKVDLYVTNNDSVDTLEQADMEYFLTLLTPGATPYNSYWWGSGANIGIGRISKGQNYYSPGPVTFLSGGWGSLAIYSDDYSGNWTFGSATSGSGSNGGASFLMDFANHGSNGGSASNVLSDPIPPGQTRHYDFYIRFGSPSDTPTSLASAGYAAWRSTVPYLVNWPNRAPIARWFIADGTKASATNPRGYLSDPTLDVSNQANFNSRIMAAASSTIATMNKMSPKPQGILIWDLEGEEFTQPFTYVGYPNELPELSPEMDAVANQLISTIQGAGYQVGLTLRPSTFDAGASLPSTCYHDSDNNADSDVYVLTTAAYPHRGYLCTATNTWSQPGSKLPAQQTGSDVDSVILSNLESKVSYAESRWGIHMFYVDSTVYGDAGTGFSYLIWRQLEAYCPSCVFFPEEPGGFLAYGASAAYTDAKPGASTVGFATPQSVLDVYPNAFSAIEAEDVDLTTGSSNYNSLVQSVEAGNILFVDGWYDNEPDNGQIQKIYQAAGSGYSPPSSPSAPSPSSPSSPTVYSPPPANNSSSGGGTITGPIILNSYPLSISTAGTGQGTISSPTGVLCGGNCTSTFVVGTSLDLTAIPVPGSSFVSWTGCDSTSGSSCTVVIGSARSITATFNSLPPPPVVTSTTTPPASIPQPVVTTPAPAPVSTPTVTPIIVNISPSSSSAHPGTIALILSTNLPTSNVFVRMTTIGPNYTEDITPSGLSPTVTNNVPASVIHFIVPSNAPIGSYNVYVGSGSTLSAPYSWSISPPAPTSSSTSVSPTRYSLPLAKSLISGSSVTSSISSAGTEQGTVSSAPAANSAAAPTPTAAPAQTGALTDTQNSASSYNTPAPTEPSSAVGLYYPNTAPAPTSAPALTEKTDNLALPVPTTSDAVLAVPQNTSQFLLSYLTDHTGSLPSLFQYVLGRIQKGMERIVGDVSGQ